MPKPKIYVVWRGRTPGLYHSWDECKAMVEGYAGARYKSYETLFEAKEALAKGAPEKPGEVMKAGGPKPAQQQMFHSKPLLASISVDAAWNTMSGDMEYRGVDTKTREQIFHVGPLADGTNNVGEFLAIVHGLAYCQKYKLDLPIYSDSANAIAWVKRKKHASKLVPNARNKVIFDLLERAQLWLQQNTYPNPVLKWETKRWGENPADFGRK